MSVVGMDVPRNYLPCHFEPRIGICKVSGKTKISNLELTVRSNEQIVWFQVLRDKAGQPRGWNVGGVSDGTRCKIQLR